MARFHTYGQNETPPRRLGDTRFVGVNSRLDPHTLPPGYVADAVNMRFVRGVPETRLGTMVLPWANNVSNWAIQAWGTIYGVGVFNDPQTLQDYLIIAADGNVYFCQPHNVPQIMTLPAGVTVASPVTFTQAFNVLLMHRGFGSKTLQLTGIYNAWQFISQSAAEAGDGAIEIPNSERSQFFQNRLFIPKDNDEIAVSDFNDYTRYAPVAQELKINQGSSDRVVNITKFNDITMIIFKDRSVYALSNVFGALSNATLDLLNDQFGLAAAKSVAHCGNDLLFLSEHGVMSIRQTEQNKLQSVTIPLSDPIQPVIDRINWQYAGDSVAQYWDNKYYLAVPLDEAEQIGPELVSAQMAYNTIPDTITVQVTVGATYRWEKTEFETNLVNGTQTLTNSADFTAQGSTVALTGNSDVILSCSLKRVYKGVNNAILVYDFLNQAWAGYDQSDGLIVKEMFLFPYNGQRRMFISTHEGFVKLYEEDYEDQLSIPTATLTVNSAPPATTTIRVNSGDTITAISSSTNSGTDWGCSTVGFARQNIIYVLGPGTRSYSPLADSPWSAPYTFPFNTGTTSGVPGPAKFYGLTGRIPNVLTGIKSITSLTRSGNTATATTSTTHGYTNEDVVTVDGANESKYNITTTITVTSGSSFTYTVNGDPTTPATGVIKCGRALNASDTWGTVVETQQQAITATLVTRAYTDPEGDLSDYQWLHCDLQTWNPSYSIDVISPGAEEVFAQEEDQTKDRRKWYRPFDKPDFAVGNTDGRFMDKWRKDYSVKFGSATGETTSLRVDTTSGGVRLDLHQDSRETFHLNRDARSLQAKIVNTQGRIRVMGVLLEAAKVTTPGFAMA